ncbi:MAG: hypothetical protein ABIN67_04520 [Ferruginibacter sp.]
MNDLILDKDGNFVVRESVLLNTIMGFIFLAILIGVLFTRNFEANQPIGSFHLIYLFLIVGIVAVFTKAKRRDVILIINKNGIYYRSKLVSDWPNFINAYIYQEDYVVSNNSDGLNDKFYVVITFFEPQSEANYMYKVPMSNSQDKSEYQVISAIEYFSKKKLSQNII